MAWPTWTGLSADDNWTTAANWANSILRRKPGDVLIFTGSTQTNSVNNYLADTQFSSIVIQGSTFNLQGNQVDLTMASGVTSTGSNNAISLPIDLLHNSAISVTSGTLSMGAINNGGNTLTVDAAAGTTANLTGALQGSGGIQLNGTGTVNSSATNTVGGTITVASRAHAYIINSASSFPVGGSLVIGIAASSGAAFNISAPAATSAASVSQVAAVEDSTAPTTVAKPQAAAESTSNVVGTFPIISARQPVLVGKTPVADAHVNYFPSLRSKGSVAVNNAPARRINEVPWQFALPTLNESSLNTRLTAAAVDAIMAYQPAI